MSIQELVEFASNVISAQTRSIRKRLRKNRNRIVYLVQNDDGLHRHVYGIRKAFRLAARHGAWVYQGEQNINWIEAGNLTGCHWNKRRVWYVPKDFFTKE
jgi:hypothetical protein